MSYRAYLGRLSSAEYQTLVKEGLEYIRFGETVSADTRVFIKANLTFPEYRPGVMTHPDAIEAAIIAISDYTSHIMIGDADSGGYNRFSMHEVYRETGIDDIARKHGVKVVNLSDGQRKPLKFRYKCRNFAIQLPVLLTEECDLTVTMPVPKIHANAGVSLSFKNQWGCIPIPRDRLGLHPYLERVIIEVNKAVKTNVAIIDGTYGLNRNGPMRGDAVPLDWVLVVNDLGTGARVATELMQFNLDKSPHLKYARKQGLIPDLDEIEMNQDFRPFLREKFYLKREFWDYPGVLTYNSSILAYIGYYSPLAGLLHKLMYMFREPFYNHKTGKAK